MLLMTQYSVCDAILGAACTDNAGCRSSNNEICTNGVCSCDTATHYPDFIFCRLCEYSYL